jgi:hypothetical protein
MQSFEGKNGYSVECESKPRRGGFKHEATLLLNGREIGKAKALYVNRTWEAYQYDTVRSLLREKYPESEAN